MKTLKQSFTTEKGNLIEIIGTKTTGRGLNSVEHTIRVNGELQEQTYNQDQLFNMMTLKTK